MDNTGKGKTPDKNDSTDAYAFTASIPSAPEARPAGPIKLILDEYNFSHPRRGKAVIINQKNFDQRLTGQLNRDGTDIDASNLESVFAMLGFDVTRYDDLNTLDLSINLRQIAGEDYSDADCFVCAILSHGEEGYVYGTNGRVTIDSIIKNFKGDASPSLAGKPKMFFIQACRGRKYDWGVEVADEDSTDAGLENLAIRKIPIEADLLLAYSVVPGYFSWRNNVDGSWFIQAVTRVFREHWDKMELMQMMTLVSKVVAYDFQSCTDDDFTSNMKQVPCMVSTLTKQVFFRPKY